MGLLKLVNDNLDINYYEYRDTTYWGKYRYRARVTIPSGRLAFYAKSVQDWKFNLLNSNNYYSKKLSKDDKTFLLSKEPIISKFVEFKKQLKLKKLGLSRAESNTISFFSNDLDLLKSIRDWNDNVDLTEVKTSQFSGTKYFCKQPKFNYRIYFKTKRIDSATRDALIQLLAAQKNLKPCTSFTKWLNNSGSTWRYKYLSSGYFIDYNDESTVSYLMLLHGELFGKRYKLEKRPED